MSDKMTRNFTKEEVACPCCGLLPTYAFMLMVQGVRDYAGVPLSVSSCARCETHNESIGGASKSHHIVDGNESQDDKHGAIDIRVSPKDGVLRYKIVAGAVKLGFTGIEIGTHHVHLDTRKTTPFMWTGVSK